MAQIIKSKVKKKNNKKANTPPFLKEIKSTTRKARERWDEKHKDNVANVLNPVRKIRKYKAGKTINKLKKKGSKKLKGLK